MMARSPVVMGARSALVMGAWGGVGWGRLGWVCEAGRWQEHVKLQENPGSNKSEKHRLASEQADLLYSICRPALLLCLGGGGRGGGGQASSRLLSSWPRSLLDHMGRRAGGDG